MPSVLEARELRLDVLCPRIHDGAVLAAYGLWHHVWFSTFRKLDGRTHLDSNDFTRQDEILAISYRGSCIGVTALRWVERSNRVAREDSYFRRWPPEALEKLGGSLAISSNTAVAEGVRRARIRSSGGQLQRLSELVIGLALRRFVASESSEFVGIARNRRKMDRVGAVLGGRVIGRIAMHGEESDIIQFSRSTLLPLSAAVEEIWSRCALGGGESSR